MNKIDIIDNYNYDLPITLENIEEGFILSDSFKYHGITDPETDAQSFETSGFISKKNYDTFTDSLSESYSYAKEPKRVTIWRDQEYSSKIKYLKWGLPIPLIKPTTNKSSFGNRNNKDYRYHVARPMNLTSQLLGPGSRRDVRKSVLESVNFDYIWTNLEPNQLYAVIDSSMLHTLKTELEALSSITNENDLNLINSIRYRIQELLMPLGIRIAERLALIIVLKELKVIHLSRINSCMFDIDILNGTIKDEVVLGEKGITLETLKNHLEILKRTPTLGISYLRNLHNEYITQIEEYIVSKTDL